jgi:hypothetical protein
VDSVEIGNEPGKWSDADYTRLFKAMAEGIRAGDPKLKIATCNLTTGKSGDYEKSVECVAELPELFDVLNIHTYAQLEGWPTWQRSFPEDPKLPKYLQDVEALCRWRDAHAPGKPVWITEFGYDSSTKLAEKSGTFAKWQGVTDEQQAHVLKGIRHACCQGGGVICAKSWQYRRHLFERVIHTAALLAFGQFDTAFNSVRAICRDSSGVISVFLCGRGFSCSSRDQHRTRSHSYYSFCHTAHQDVSQPCPTVGTHYYQICLFVFSGIHNGLEGNAVNDDGLSLKTYIV